ncbi:PilC/PilY family type IV pilus protein, partial [Conchiformibius steedae]|uniref:PilC/PilY family type IV pilus protein n=1 Tax=Conchiformibius steedae TaxID=153493 RepID=UPI0026ECA32E
THSSGIGVKPNVVLQIDNSYSMYAYPHENNPNKPVPRHDIDKSRLEITKRALRRILSNPKYRDQINWQMITLWDKPVESYDHTFGVDDTPTWYARRRTDWWVDYAEKFLKGEVPFGRPIAELEKMINDLTATGYTPTTERYFDSIYLLQKALERPDTYRCQKSAVIIFSDGVPSTASYYNKQPTAAFARSYAAPMVKDTGGSDRIMAKSFYLSPENEHYMRINHQTNGGTDEPLIKFAWKDPYVYGHPNIHYFRRSQSEASPPHYNLFAFDNLQGVHQYGYSFINTPLNSPSLGAYDYWTQRGYALRFLAESVFLNDLRTDNQSVGPIGKQRRLPALDAAGKSFDEYPFKKQNIDTYTIAFGIRPEDSITGYTYLKTGATGTSPDVNSRKVFDARTEESLNKAFDSILESIAAKSLFEPPASFSGISPTVSSDEETRKVPNMAATTHLSMKTGSSEIYFYEVDSSKQGNTAVVKDRHTTPSFGNRRVLINDGRNTTWLHTFNGNNAFFGIPTTNNNGNEWQRSMIPWIARSQADNTLNYQGNALKYRNRVDVYDGMTRNTRNMGDVVYSPILAYGPNEYGRQKYLMTAANDGMVYLFGSSNNRNNPYDLKLNYIPAGMERESTEDTMGKHFRYLVHPNYVQDFDEAPHQFMVNGGFVMRTMDRNGPQQIFMAGNMGQGGRGMYALNVGGPSRANGSQKVGIDAPQNDWPTSVPLMETPKGDANKEMGYTINSPQIGRLSLNRSVVKEAGERKGEMRTDLLNLNYAIFVNSGVSNPFKRGDGTVGSDKTESALYIYSPFDNLNVGAAVPASATNPNVPPPEDNEQKHPPLKKGELIAKIAVPESMGKGGLAQPTLVDINLDGAIDIVYAGDYSGGLYRFDLRGRKQDWTVHKIFQTLDGQPITSAPAVFRDEQNKYIVTFGTGSDLYQKDLDDTNVQAMYGVYEDLTNFEPQVKRPSDLVKQTITQHRTAVKGKDYDVRTVSDHNAGDPNIKGWYFEFPAGERVVVKPNVLLKSVLFSTRTYRVNRKGSKGETTTGKPDACLQSSYSETSEGESWVMQVKVDNGGNIPSGKDADQVYAYADFLSQYTRDEENKTYTRPDDLYSGFRSEGGIVNMALLFGVNKDPNGIGGIQSSYTRDGDAGDSGIDPPPGAEILELCVAEDNN